MKDFAVYTLARLALFVASFAVAYGVLALVGYPSVLLSVVLAAVASAVASYFLLQGPRQRFASSVERRAEAMSRRFEEARAKEDSD